MIDKAIERNFLGHLIFVGSSPAGIDTCYSIIERIDNRYFSDEKHRIIYNAVVGVFMEFGKINKPAIYQSLIDCKMLELAGGQSYITQIITGRDLSTDLLYLANVLYQRGKRNDLISTLEESIAKLKNDKAISYEEIIDEHDAKITAIRHIEKDTMVDIVKEAEHLIERTNNSEKFGLFGYSWGIAKLDYITTGIEKGKTYVVGATKKSGKTRFVINTIEALKRKDVQMLFLSMEMRGDSLVPEIISRVLQVPNTTFKHKLSDNMIEDIRRTARDIQRNPFIDAQGYLSIQQIRHKVSVAARRGVKVVFLDYLQRMNFKFGNGLNAATVISHTVAQLADIAREFNVAFIFLSQLSNAADNQSADISFLKDSGGIAEGCDAILILNNIDRINKTYDDSKKSNEIHINVEQRSGMSGVIYCDVDLSRSMFTEKERPASIPQQTKGTNNWKAQ